jgi:hypothetical protein
MRKTTTTTTTKRRRMYRDWMTYEYNPSEVCVEFLGILEFEKADGT